MQIIPRKKQELHLIKLAEALKKSGRVAVNEFLLRFSPEEDLLITVFKDARVLIHGTNDIVTAKALYAKYIGN